jgi:hypothetical protein
MKNKTRQVLLEMHRNGVQRQHCKRGRIQTPRKSAILFSTCAWGPQGQGRPARESERNLCAWPLNSLSSRTVGSRNCADESVPPSYVARLCVPEEFDQLEQAHNLEDAEGLDGAQNADIAQYGAGRFSGAGRVGVAVVLRSGRKPKKC